LNNVFIENDKYAGCNSAYTVLEWLLQFVKFELISTLKLSRGLPLMHPGRQSIWRGCR